MHFDDNVRLYCKFVEDIGVLLLLLLLLLLLKYDNDFVLLCGVLLYK